MKQLLITLLILGTYLVNGQNREADSLILVQIYNNLDGANWTNQDNWLSGEAINEWKGVNVTNDRVTTLSLTSQNIKGAFPNEIIKLDQLRSLDLRSGELSGEISQDFVQLTELNRFVISTLKMTGEIPNIWTSFPKLQYLGFSSNQFTGSLPDIPDNLTLLTFRNNLLSGPIPASWANKNIGNVDISNNKLTGTFDVFSTWPILTKVELGPNDWDPSLFPSWADDNINMERFVCNNCNLYGAIPEGIDFSQHQNYQGMFLRNNELSGDVSKLFTGEDSSSELYFSISNNNFSGEFPAHKIIDFSRVIISGNNYTSITPFSDVELSSCDIKNNKFNFSALLPVQQYVMENDIIPLDYDRQSKTLTADTILVKEVMDITLEAGDDHPNTQYQWKEGNSDIDGATKAQLTLTIADDSDGGRYWCRMINADFPGLTLDRNNVTINVDLSTSSFDEEILQPKIYPNPAQSFLKVSNINFRNSSYIIHSLDGKDILSGSVKSDDFINLESINKGMYLISIKTEEHIHTQRFVKH